MADESVPRVIMDADEERPYFAEPAPSVIPTVPFDPVQKPRHYNVHPSGVECIVITEHMNFCIGNAIKYLWRADDKNNDLQDLEKAVWYVNREIARRRRLAEGKKGGSSR